MPQRVPLLEARNIHKTFCGPPPCTILRGVDLVLREGESIAIVGRSGEGKSSLLHILGTLEPASSGELMIAGEPITPWNQSRMRNEKIGFVFQSFYLFEEFSVLENVLMGARVGRRSVAPGGAAWTNAHRLLDQVGLLHRKDFLAKILSGGEKQRVALARAMCLAPPILLADEPSGNLDSVTAALIHDILLQYPKQTDAEGRRCSLLLVTHDERLARCCDRVLVLVDGCFAEG